MLLGPVADQRQVGTESVGDDVVCVADVERAVANAREARDVLDHLCVVVGRQERFALGAVLHRQPADEVGQPDVGGPLLLGVLVQVVVELPGLVADPEVVLVVADDVVEDHEVREQDLVHAADRLEAVQVVLGALALDVARLVREVSARGMDALPACLQHRGHRMLSEPVDLEVGMELAQLFRDRGIALRVAEPDRRGDVERALSARLAAHPAAWRRRRLHEVAQEQVDLDGVACMREMARPFEYRELAVRKLRESRTGGARAHRVVASVDHEHRAVDAGQELTDGILVLQAGRKLRRDQRFGVRLEPPADRILALLRGVRLGEALREEELEEVLIVLEPVVAVPLPPAVVLGARLEELLGRLAARHDRWQRQRRRDEHHPLHPLRVVRGKQ